MEGALSFYSVGKDFGSTGTRAVSLGLIGGSVIPLDKGGRPVAVAPSHCFTYRKVRLPQAGAKACRRIVQEELTFGLPLPLHQCVWDYYMQPGPEAFAVVAQLNKWQELTGRWGAIQGADPEPLCYLRVALHMHISDALIVDFGASHTTWVSIAGGKIDWVRTMMRGGQAMSQYLADQARVGLGEAEDLKRRRGTELPEVKAFLAELLEEALLPRPLTQRRVLLCGGGANMPGLRAYLHSQLGIEPEPFPMPPLLSPHEHVSALGAALSARFGQQRMSLQSSTPVSSESSLNSWLAVAFACLGLWIVGLEIRYQGLTQEQAGLRGQFRKSAAAMGVNLPPNLDNPTQAEKWLAQQQTYRQGVRAHSVATVADGIALAAQALRDIGDCSLYSITFDEGKLLLEGEAPNNLKAQQLRQKWSQVFPELQQKKLQPGVGGRFRFEFQGGLPKP